MDNKQQVVIQPPAQPAVQTTNIELMLQTAIEKGLPIETLERLLAMRKELRAEAAKQAYDEAMAKLQGELPIIEKKKEAKNRSGVVMYKFAPLEAIIDQSKEAIAKNGFSYGFKTDVTETRVKVYCTVKHQAGHSEVTDFDIPLATRTEIMNAPQQVAATVTFAKRYAFKNAFGIETDDEDTDAQGEEKKDSKATQEQFDKIDKLSADAGITKAYVVQRCREIYGVSYTGINAVQADGIITMLTKKVSEKNTTK